jgi:hypothetical protein
MLCGHCLQPVNDVIEHELCKEAVWFAISKQFTEAREAFKKQYDFEPKGCTVELREPLERSASR